jgi:hypothetical protein
LERKLSRGQPDPDKQTRQVVGERSRDAEHQGSPQDLGPENVRVRINQAGQKRLAPRVNDAGAVGRLDLRPNRRDPAIPHQHGRARQHLRPIENASVAEDERTSGLRAPRHVARQHHRTKENHQSSTLGRHRSTLKYRRLGVNSSRGLETTIPSLLTAWPSRDLIIAADQQSTRDWWENRRRDFELLVSPEVLGEAAQGDPEAARLRLEAIATFPVLAATEEVEGLTRVILTTGLIPARATRDAAHIAFAAVHGMDFLRTWNCRHIHNAMISRRLAGVCSAQGFTLPVLCTPHELMLI